MKNELENIYHSKINNLNFLLVDITYRKPHLHFDIELAFVLEGTGTVRTQEHSFEISAEQAIIFNNCQLHEFSSRGEMKLLILQFSTQIFEMVSPQLDKIHFESGPFNLRDQPETLRLLLKTALSYFSKDGNTPPRILRTHGYAFLLLNHLLDITPYNILSSFEQNKLMDLQGRMERISTYIHENYDQKISLDSMASREGFSRTYFSHFFKRNFGITFKDYLNNLRCEKARTLLTTKENLLNISYMCGFSDIRSLNTAFVKFYGVLPKDYRRNNTLPPKPEPISFNQDEIDNQVFYSDQGSFDILRYYFEKHFEVVPIGF
ncbi:AraC family transcriptional regulator [uncultured Lactococcus sp.]|nr:AraC family transcriptional regulator [uncultured Lactococcus sp.]